MDTNYLRELCGITESVQLKDVSNIPSKPDSSKIDDSTKPNKSAEASKAESSPSRFDKKVDELELDSSPKELTPKSDNSCEYSTHTISISKSGAPQIDNTLKKVKMTVGKWGDLAKEGDVGFCVNINDNYLQVNEDETLQLGDRENGTVFESLEEAEIYSNKVKDSHIVKLSVAIDEGINDGNVSSDPREEQAKSMIRMIRIMLNRNEPIYVSVSSGGTKFVGQLSSISSNVMMVRPNPATKQLLNLKSWDPQLIRFNPKALKWNQAEHRVEGIVPPFANVEHIDMTKTPVPAFDNNPGRLVNSNKAGKPPLGSSKDPNSWMIDMSSAKGPDGAALNEGDKSDEYTLSAKLIVNDDLVTKVAKECNLTEDEVHVKIKTLFKDLSAPSKIKKFLK